MSYAQDRADFEYLKALAEVEDMVEIDASVWSLIRNPCKVEAARLYQASIRLWFQEHGDGFLNDEVDEIAHRHGVDL